MNTSKPIIYLLPFSCEEHPPQQRMSQIIICYGFSAKLVIFFVLFIALRHSRNFLVYAKKQERKRRDHIYTNLTIMAY